MSKFSRGILSWMVCAVLAISTIGVGTVDVKAMKLDDNSGELLEVSEEVYEGEQVASVGVAPEYTDSSVIATVTDAELEVVEDYSASSTESAMNVTKRTKTQILNFIAKHPYQLSLLDTYAVAPVTTSPYKLGRISDVTAQNALNYVNVCRYIAGLSGMVEYDSTYEEYTQAGAMVNYANGTLTHTPSQPADMSDAMYQLGKTGNGSSNIAMGYRNTITSIADGYMEDGDSYNIDRVGHRRWILNPSMSKTGFGSVGRYYAMYAFDRGNYSAEEYGVSWPAQTMPVEFFGSYYPWSISFGQTVSSDAKVKLTNTKTGKVWNFSNSSADGPFYINNSRYGQVGCIIFRPNNIDGYYEGDNFKVEISDIGAYDLPNTLTYNVNFISLAPDVGSLAIKSNGIQVKWSEISNATSYDIYRSTDGGYYSRIGTTSNLSYVDDTVYGSHEYKYAITYNIKKNGIEYSSKYNEGKSIYYMDTPILSGVTNTKTGVKVEWEAVLGASKYRVYRKDASGSWTKLKDVSGTSYIDTTAKSGTKYYYTVRCLSPVDGTCCSYYNTTGKGITYVATPKISTVSCTTTGVKVSWANITGAAKYRVYRKENGGSWKKLIDTAELNYVDISAKSGVQYTYTVRCVNSAGTKLTSDYYKTGKTITFIAAPVISSVSSTTSGVKVAWGKVAGAEKYRVFRKTGTGSWTKIADTTSISYTDKTAVKGKTYVYTIRCIKADGSGYTSAYDSAGKKITFK